MKFEEVLPAYREGKMIISCTGNGYQKDTNFEIGILYGYEILGEWEIKEGIKK